MHMTFQDAQPCTKHKKNGEPCKAPAIKGTDTCRMHAGKSAALAKQDGTRNLALAEIRAQWAGLPVDENEAILGEIRKCYAMIQFLEQEMDRRAEDGDAQTGGLVGLRENQFGMERVTSPEAVELRWQRTHLAKVAAVAIGKGISELRIEAERTASADLVAVFDRVLDHFNVSTGSERDKVVAAHLQALAASSNN